MGGCSRWDLDEKEDKLRPDGFPEKLPDTLDVDVWRFLRGSQGQMRLVCTRRLVPRAVTALFNPGMCCSGPLRERRMVTVSYAGHQYEVRKDQDQYMIALSSDAPLDWPYQERTPGTIPADPEGKECPTCHKRGGRTVTFPSEGRPESLWWCPWCSAEAAKRR